MHFGTLMLCKRIIYALLDDYSRGKSAWRLYYSWGKSAFVLEKNLNSLYNQSTEETEVYAMLKRKIYDELMRWKSRGDKQCLVVKGARQVGKNSHFQR